MERSNKLLATHEKKMINLTELETLFIPFVNTYDEFAKQILELEEQQILLEVKSKKRTSRNPSLAYQYRIQKHLLTENFHRELQSYRQVFHQAISLDEYYRKDPSIWKRDLPYIKKIDDYLKEHSLPEEQVPAPERSYELVGDEKWIVEQGGKEVLERLSLFHDLQIIPVSEPLMFAINPTRIQQSHQLHLIVENKTTYQGLLPALTDTIFSTLIYGSGKTVISSIDQFTAQFPVKADHRFWYFGDIDREGISIWASLHKKIPVDLAIPFYQACMEKSASKGKTNQRENEEALVKFLTYFSETEQEMISTLLKNGHYHPQETLKTRELQRIWRETDWTNMRSRS